MNEAISQGGSGEKPAHSLALILLQLAACRAGIGPFAQEGREAPQVAARRYRAAGYFIPARRREVLA